MQQVLLLVRPQLLRDAIAERLRAIPNFAIVGEVDCELDLLIAVRATEATLIIHCWPDESLPAIYTHLFAEYPGLTILGLSPSGEHSWICEQKISQTKVKHSDLESVLAMLSPSHSRSVQISA